MHSGDYPGGEYGAAQAGEVIDIQIIPHCAAVPQMVIASPTSARSNAAEINPKPALPGCVNSAITVVPAVAHVFARCRPMKPEAPRTGSRRSSVQFQFDRFGTQLAYALRWCTCIVARLPDGPEGPATRGT